MGEYRVWWVIRGGAFSSQRALQDILRIRTIDDYTTRPSFLNFHKSFTNKVKAKKFNDVLTKRLFDFSWYKRADCSACGIEIKEDGEWCELN